MVCSRQEQWVAAENCFEEAVTRARALPSPYAEGCARYEWGRMLARQGEPGRAEEQLQAALAILEPLGAQPFIQRTQNALASLPAA
jgi:hypothetical protein